MDTRTAEKLEKLHPELKRRIIALLTNLQNLGFDVRVTDGLRTFDEQNKLYQKGRRGVSGEKIVTNAKGGQSNHNYGLAADLCPFKNNLPDYNDLKTFKIIGREAKSVGLEWGGDWKFTDMPHVQLRGLSVKECQKLYAAGGITRVWQRMFEILGGAKPEVFFPKVDDLLEIGDKGDEITSLQQQLAELGFLRPHEIDGHFGKITKNAVIGFQRQNNLTADGIVGPGTRSKLQFVIEQKKQFDNLSDEELESAAIPSNLPVPGEKPAVPAREQNNSANFPPSLPSAELPPNPETIAGTITEKISATKETAEGVFKKTIEESKDVFNPKNLPAFIPRFSWKSWLLGLIPGTGFLATVWSWYAEAPVWIQIAIAAAAIIALWKILELVIAHRQKVLDFIRRCYEITADPQMDNLIPTDAKEYVGKRNNALLSAFAPKVEISEKQEEE